jgi:RNA polymerase sigma-70 factor (ECF subfamily)
VNADGRDPRTDEVLLAAITEDDRGALTALYHRHAAWLTVRLTHRCGDSDVVDLALHDTFMAVWRKPGRIAARARLRLGCEASLFGA